MPAERPGEVGAAVGDVTMIGTTSYGEPIQLSVMLGAATVFADVLEHRAREPDKSGTARLRA